MGKWVHMDTKMPRGHLDTWLLSTFKCSKYKSKSSNKISESELRIELEKPRPPELQN